jgi:coenzyme F420-reducing hydrogenase delta subunit
MALTDGGSNLNKFYKDKYKAAEGFLPNFANPLKDAIGREMAAGVPASQIYVDKNPSLKSVGNPMGLMVANRRDEPAGGYQGINRAIKEGRNPKTYGAASGFVPNYAPIPAIPTSRASTQPSGQKDMLGTIFALQAGFSILTGYTDNLSSGMGLVIKNLSSMASGITTAAFAYQGAQRVATESTGKMGKALGNAGMIGAVALGGFEVFKASIQIYRDATGKTAEAAKTTAEFSEAMKIAGISIDSLSASAKAQALKQAEGSLYNLGSGIDLFDGIFGRGYKDPEMKKMYAETQYITGMTEGQIRDYLIKEGATTKTSSLVKTGRKNQEGKDIFNYALDTDNDKARAALAKKVAMPERGTPEYEERIQRLNKLKQDQARLERDIAEPSENLTRINSANLALLQLQLQNRIAYKNALFEVMSAEEYSLSLQKEMLSVGENDRMQADYKLQSLQAAKKATLEQANATVEVLKNSDLITSKLKGAGIGLDEIDPKKFKEIAGISEEISDSIKKQGGFTKEVENKTNELLTRLALGGEQQKLILDLLNETNGEIEKRISLETKVNALNNLQKATLEASNFAAQKRLDSITSGYDVTLKQNEIAKRNLDLDLEAFKIQKEREKIGKGSAATLAIDKEIIEKEKITLKAKLDIDKQDLIVQVQKTLADAAIKAGATPDQIAGLNLGDINNQSKAIEAAKKIEQIEKDIQINKIDIAQKEFESNIKASDFLYEKIVAAANTFKDTISNLSPIGIIQNLIGKRKEQGPILGPEAPTEAQRLLMEAQSNAEAAKKAVNEASTSLVSGIENTDRKSTRLNSSHSLTLQ